jgi:hypothetical protein
MQILQTNIFKKAVKKLHANQKICLDNAVKALVINPLLGVAVYVFINFIWLIA